MEKFKKKRLSILSGISLVLVSIASFNLKIKEESLQENTRELLAMFVQDENGEYSPNTSKEFPKEG